jgi:TonB family protein
VSDTLILDNLVQYSLQIGMLVGLAAFVPAILRLRLPGAKLAYWHILLAACLLVPLAAPKRQDVAAGTVEITSKVIAVQPGAPAHGPWVPTRSQMALMALAAGTLARLAWLGMGLRRLRQYRRHSRPLEPASSWSVEADVRVSGDISSPVTFGWRRPVILLPAQFPALDPRMREAILCHEVLHVRRRDWLFTLGEELVRAAFWFHPAIWWLLGEIALAREQAVDREVIATTKTRDEYVDALLVIAGANPQLDLAPAPLFLRKRHLKQRVISILKEVRMSKTRLISALAAGLGILAAACWFTTGTFPLSAAPQADAQGVTVDMRGATVMHRAAVAYPETARRAGVQGMVVVEVKVDSAGNVGDARVLNGPDELRRAALESVLGWHFTRDSANGTRQVAIAFALPEGQARKTAAAPAAVAEPVAPRGNSATQLPPVGRIDITGLAAANRDELLARLPIHEGDTPTPELVRRLTAVVRDYDEHLTISIGRSGADTSTLRIAAPQFEAQAVDSPAPRIRVGGSVQQNKLVTKVVPVYPPLAKQARIQGVVRLQATIAKDGHITYLEPLSGHPLLIEAAVNAVKQWVYETTLLNGNPVEVLTQIDVNFTLSDNPPAPPQQ